MNEYKVSIIVPVYNVEKYLRQCMESLVNQTLKEIEIIVVNDGSPDNSIKILEEYEKKYPDMVKVFTTENRGVSHARNYGLDHATGEYIMFVDSDDFVELNMAEKLYKKAVEDNNDLVICSRYNVYEVEGKKELKRKEMKLFSMNQNFKMSERKFELAHISPFPWDKLFKRTLLDGIRFPEGIRFEDLVVAFEAAVMAESIGIVPEPLYNYRKTTQVGFLNSFSEATKDIVKAFTLLFDFMKENDLFDTFKEELEYICTRHFFFRYESFYTDSKKGQLQLKKEIIDITQDFLNKEIPGWVDNHYLKYTASPALKKHLKYYVDKNKTIRYVTMREKVPPKVYNGVVKIISIQDKINKKWKKFKKSRHKVKYIIGGLKKLRIFKVFNLPPDVKYAQYYEKLAVNDKIILFESKHGDDLAGNIFNMIYETRRDKYKDFHVLLVLKKELFETYDRLLKNYNIHHVTFVELHSDEYLRALAVAKYLVTDTSFPPYFIKKPEQVYLNTWHGTPLKAMGRIVPDREYALGNVQRNFNIADYLLYQNEFSRDIFLTDYMLNKIYEGKILLSGYPRNSSFYRTDRRDKIRSECGLEHMQVIVYMPTWRGLLHKKESKAQVNRIFGYLAHLDHKLKENQVLFVKLHPFVKKGIDYSQFLHIKEFPADYETYDFLNASDMLITDYSSIMFDYAVSKKKIILFTYDREEYLGDRGIYIGLDEMDLPKVETVDELVKEINNPEFSYPKFYKQFCSLDSADTAKNVCDTVFLNEENLVRTENYYKTDVDNVLVYVKALRDNEEDKHFIDEINHLDLKEKNYFLHFKSGAMKKTSRMLSLLDKEVGYIPISAGRNYTLSEYIAFTLTFRFGIENSYTKKKLQSLAKRERAKYYGTTEFDYVIYYSGMDLMLLHIFDTFDGKKIFNFHDFDMQKYKSSGKYRRNVRYALRNLANYNLVLIPSSMKNLKEVQELKDKVRIVVCDTSAISVDAILKEAR
jgi:CDP-glycerol glycerophosphotransferase